MSQVNGIALQYDGTENMISARLRLEQGSVQRINCERQFTHKEGGVVSSMGH